MTTFEQVKIRLKQFHMENVDGKDVVVFDKIEDNPLIEQLIEQAKKDVIAKRCSPDSYTQEMIEEDMNYFDGVIVNLVVYDYSQAGENYMSSFSENGVSRHWRDRDSLFVGVYPFVKALERRLCVIGFAVQMR